MMTPAKLVVAGSLFVILAFPSAASSAIPQTYAFPGDVVNKCNGETVLLNLEPFTARLSPNGFRSADGDSLLDDPEPQMGGEL
jgi:hypothetical protein